MAIAVLFLAAACVQDVESTKQAAVRARAAGMLEVLRAERWGEAAGFVSVDSATQERMEIPEGASPEATRAEIARWFETLYRNVPPRFVHSVAFHPQDSVLAIVTYTAGDLDTFHMRLVDGEWYYTLDWRPKPE